MRHYKPTYPARYTPRAAGEPTGPQIGLAPLVRDRTPTVVSASALYGRQARSVRALFADSRISGAGRRRIFNADGSVIDESVTGPKSPYYAIRLHPEQQQAILQKIGYVPADFPAPMWCGAQKTDSRDTEISLSLAELGIMHGVEDNNDGTTNPSHGRASALYGPRPLSGLAGPRGKSLTP